MANESTQTANTQPEAIELAAAALRGETTVAKANPVADEGAKTEDVAKAAETTPEDVAKAEAPPFAKKEDDDDKEDVKKALAVLTAAIPDIVAQAVSAAVTPLNSELAEVRKSLAVVEASTAATLNFQSATTGILTSIRDEVEEQGVVQKSVQVTVQNVAAQPAGRKSASNNVEVTKALATTAELPKIDVQPLRDWARAEGYSLADRTAFVHNANAGDYTGIPAEVRKSMGVTNE